MSTPAIAPPPVGHTPAGPAQALGDWRRPLRRGLATAALTLCGFFGWAGFAPLESAVSANGTIVPDGDRKVVQHLEGGVVTRIGVKEGDRVTAGEVLFVVDPTQAHASRNATLKSLQMLLGDEARLVALLENRDTIVFPEELVGSGPEADRVIADERRLLVEMRTAIANDVAVLDNRLESTRVQSEGTRAQWDSVRFQVASLDAEIERLQPAVLKGSVSRSRQNMLERERSDLDGKASALAAELSRLARSGEELALQKSQVRRKATEDAAGKLTEVRSRIADIREKLRVTESVVDRTEIRAPRTGRVVASRLHTVGAVVRPGETLMEIVPEDAGLVVSVRVSPLDITHVSTGLTAEVRLPSFKSRSTPTAYGEVTMVAPDVVVDDATRLPHYEVRIAVKTADLPAEIRDRLRPGMPVDAIIKVGERTVLAYLAQPLQDALRHGMREQ